MTPTNRPIEDSAATLARRFPGVAVWFGPATRRWWALVRSTGRWCLVEAGGPRALSQMIDSAMAVPSPPENKASEPGVPATDGRPAKAPASARRPASPVSHRRSPGRHARVR